MFDQFSHNKKVTAILNLKSIYLLKALLFFLKISGFDLSKMSETFL